MCSYIVEKAKLMGSAKGPNGWMRIDTANVYYDHPFHAPLDHALGIDFINEAEGGRERVAVELSLGTQASDRMVGEPTTFTAAWFDAFPEAADATPVLVQARSLKTEQEVQRLRLANDERERLLKAAIALVPLHGREEPPPYGELRIFLFLHGRRAACDGLALAHAESSAPPDDPTWSAARRSSSSRAPMHAAAPTLPAANRPLKNSAQQPDPYEKSPISRPSSSRA